MMMLEILFLRIVINILNDILKIFIPPKLKQQEYAILKTINSVGL